MDDMKVDFAGIFQTLPEPVAVCDEEGFVHAMNQEARRYLAADEGAKIRVDLRARETVRQIRMTGRPTSAEFFLADLHVEGAGRQKVSASFHPLAGGGYRVLFASGPDGRKVAPNVRMLESLVNVGRHIELFKTPGKTLALFAAALADVFPAYAFRVELDEDTVYDHTAWKGGTAREGIEPADTSASDVAPEERIFRGSQRGWRVSIQNRGYVQVEKIDAEKFGVSERQAFETFAQQLALSMPREDDAGIDAVGPIIDQIDAIVIVCDARRRVLVSNRSFEQLVGSSEVEGRDVLDFFEAPEDESRIRTSAASVMAGGAAETFDAHLKTAAHGPVALKIQVAPAHSGAEESATGFVLTGQQGELSMSELEARMSRAEQLMNLGQLATGVAHELKNPLTSILNYAEYLLMKYQGSLFEERDSERLKRIIDGVERIDGFVKDLVTLARPTEGVWEEVGLHSVLKESAMMCEVTLEQHHSKLTLDLGEVDPRVKGNRNQLKQIFVNLVTNAAKAMPAGGGKVTIETRVVDGEAVCRVTDDARGMSDETLEKIFEPFFTTREKHGGTGLGLALVQTIVQNHGGVVTVESDLGVGTTFSIRLPLAGS